MLLKFFASVMRLARSLFGRTRPAEPPAVDAPRPFGVEGLENRSMLSVSPLLGGFYNVAISDSRVIEGDSGAAMAYFNITLNGIDRNPATIHYATQDGTARAGTDYQAITDASVTIKPGDTTAMIGIPVYGNTIQQPDRTFYVNITQTYGGVGIGRQQGIATIVDDDQPQVTVAAVDRKASEGGPDTGAFRITRTGPTTAALKVSYVMSGTATNGVDYKKLGGTATIAAGKSSVDVILTPLADKLNEPAEHAILTLTAQSAYLVGSANTATVDIANSETNPPRAKLAALAPITAATDADYQFTVTYTDDTAMNLTSIGDGNLVVAGPNGYLENAVLVSKTTAGRSVTAVYSIPAPGGSWDNSDNGVYHINAGAKQIKDKAGNSVTSGSLGQFTVNIA